MNLNDCLNRLPFVLRRRFSSSNNSEWLAWAADGISQIERSSVGPGNRRIVMGYQLPGGFVPKPKCLRQITNAWLDGEPVKEVREKIDTGFKMADGSVEATKLDVSYFTSIKESGTLWLDEISPSTPGFPEHRKVCLSSFGTINPKEGDIGDGGDSLPTEANSMIGWSLWVNENQYHITANTAKDSFGQWHISVYEDIQSGDVIDGESPGFDLVGVVENAMAGWEVHSGNDRFKMATSSWEVPRMGSSGWTGSLIFSCDFCEPGRSITKQAGGYAIKSNLLIEGYRSLARPSTMTESLDLPDGCEDLLVSYLWWQAERSQDKGSKETAACSAEFQAELRKYQIDQSRTDGATRPTSYRFTPSFGMRNR